MVDALLSLETQAPFWETLTKTDLESDIRSLEPEAEKITLTQQKIDDITYAFAMIVDAKSPFTHDHSSRVADYTVKLSQHFGFPLNSREKSTAVPCCMILANWG